jgi:glycosyltransferase involved in cell wall biosynthesis
MKKALFIENQKGTEHAFTRGFRIGSIRAEWKPAFVWLRDDQGNLKSAKSLSQEIEAEKPDLIVWIMDSVLPVADCLETPAISQVPKASLWFDDYERAYGIHLHSDHHRRLCKKSHLKTYVWDGYWRKQFQENFSIKTHPIHLAADNVYHHPGEPTHFKGFDDSVIFIGNIPSLQYIQEEAKVFPQPCQQLLTTTQEILSKSSYGRMPYDAMAEAYESLSPKSKTTIDHFKQDVAKRILLNRLAWMLAKRETRVRILRLAAQQRQLVVLSGHSDKSFVEVDELSRDLQSTRHQVKFIKTDHVPLDQIGCLYHIGGLHIQATDPQSVEGGIPFRVFETAASARPLLSDFKPELAECFEPDREILCFQNDQDFSEKLSSALKDQKRLQEIAKAGYERFLKEHTWKHRFEQIANPS